MLPSPTAEQQHILKHKAPCKVVVAVPGSGKTTLLFQSINRNQLTCCLLLSYSRKVKHENQAKLKQYFGEHKVTVHTLDSFCFSIVLQHKKLAGYPSEIKLDNAFDDKLLHELYDKSEIKSLIAFDELMKIIRASVTTMSLRKSLQSTDTDYSDHYDAFKALRAQYLRDRRSAGFISYKEQIRACIKLFKKHPEVLKSVTDSYGLLLVDELQDLNKDRMNIVLSLLGIQKSVLVGDDAQSIFKFAGADDQNFQRLKHIGAYFSLTQSHRCTGPVAALASVVRAKIRGVTKIKMWSAKEGDKIKLRGFKTKHKQYEYIATEIKNLQAAGVSLNDIAVIAHNHESLQKVLKQLMARDIASETKYSENLRLNEFDSQTDADYKKPLYDTVIELLQLIEYGYRYELVFKLFIYFEIQPLEEAFSYIEKELKSLNKVGSKPSVNINGLKLFGNLIVKACKAHSLEAKIHFITEYIAKQYKGTEKHYVASYLTQVNTLSRNEVDVEQLILKIETLTKSNQECVSLRTVHASKGLEYKHVFLVDADHTHFPDRRNNKNDERKLFYVAITRSLMTLTICSVINDEFKLTEFLRRLKGIRPLVHCKML